MILEELLKRTNETSQDERIILIKRYDWVDEYAELGQGLAISISRDKALLLQELTKKQKEFVNLYNFAFEYVKDIRLCPITLPEHDYEAEQKFGNFEELYPIGRDKGDLFTKVTDALYDDSIENGYSKIETSTFSDDINFIYTGKHSSLTATVSTSVRELLEAIEKALAVPAREIDIRSSVSNLTANEFGCVIDAGDAWEENGYTPVLFDFDEYRQHYNEDVPGSVDILDLGYIHKELEYEAPADDWREEVKKSLEP